MCKLKERCIQVRRLLRSSVPVALHLKQRHEIAEKDIPNYQQRRLMGLCIRTMTLPCGRAALTLGISLEYMQSFLPICVQKVSASACWFFQYDVIILYQRYVHHFCLPSSLAGREGNFISVLFFGRSYSEKVECLIDQQLSLTSKNSASNSVTTNMHLLTCLIYYYYYYYYLASQLHLQKAFAASRQARQRRHIYCRYIEAAPHRAAWYSTTKSVRNVARATECHRWSGS